VRISGVVAEVVAAMTQVVAVTVVVVDFLKSTSQSVKGIQFNWQWVVLEDLVPVEQEVKEQDQLAVG
jgi:hypothetical protein